jgi:hypothetical protein
LIVVSEFLSAHEDSGAKSRSGIDMPDRMSRTVDLMRKGLPRSQRGRGKRAR